MGKKLKPFDQTSACPKCGGKDVASHYRPEVDKDHGWYDRKHGDERDWPRGELIQRTCQRCHHKWPEACSPTPDGETA